jgi:hypothetical protein
MRRISGERSATPMRSPRRPRPAAKPNVPPGSTPATSAEAGAADAADPSAIGGPDDYQLARACDLIKGMTLFRERTVN